MNLKNLVRGKKKAVSHQLKGMERIRDREALHQAEGKGQVVLLTNDRDRRILLQEGKDLILRSRGDSCLIHHQEGEGLIAHPREERDPQKSSQGRGTDLLI